MKRILLFAVIAHMFLLVGCKKSSPGAGNEDVKIGRWTIVADKTYPVIEIYYGNGEFILLEDQEGILHLQNLHDGLPRDWVESSDGSILVRDGEKGLKKVTPRKISGNFTLTYSESEGTGFMTRPYDYYCLVRVSTNKKETYQLKVCGCGGYRGCNGDPKLQLLNTEQLPK